MTFYFYDLETSSGSPKSGRIMQFAGKRTDEDLNPIGEPDNILIKLTDDVIPEPDAVLVHGITPQKTLEEGITEAEFAKYFHKELAKPNTVFVGFNNIRFDDEFVRRLCYRTFNDPYQWHWQDGKSRWDLLDPIRMMRALRPEGLKWPFIDDKPTVKLEAMAKENGLTHDNAHDALSDVTALIELAQKFRKSQPKLFDFLLNVRSKQAVAKIAEAGQPFVYSSGRYNSEHEKTTVVSAVFRHPRRDASIVYDLREDPTPWFDKTPEELAKSWQARFYEDVEKLPVKTMMHNRCPAIAPLGVLDDDSKKRIKLDLDEVLENQDKLAKNPDFTQKLRDALDIIENEQQTRLPIAESVDDKIYDGFWEDKDQMEMKAVRKQLPEELSELVEKTRNGRIRDMIPLYKARNFSNLLSEEERNSWDEHRRKVLYGGGEKSPVAMFSRRMSEIPKQRKLTKNDEYLLTELQLYVESILPEPEA